MTNKGKVFCEKSGKITYPSKSAASKAKRAFKAKFAQSNGSHGELTAFQCNECKGWHLGRRFYNRKRRWSA